MKILVLDLELNTTTEDLNDPQSKTTDIIQIGAVVLDDKDVVASFSTFVKPSEPLSGGIKKLTGIKQTDVDDAPNILEAYNKLIDFATEHGVSRIAATWGNGDMQELRDQVESFVNHEGTLSKIGVNEDIEGYDKRLIKSSGWSGGEDEVWTIYIPKYTWFFGRYNHTGFFDVKKLYQLYRIANNKKSSGGLRKAYNSLGLPPVNGEGFHNARYDAHLTALVLAELKDKLRD